MLHCPTGNERVTVLGEASPAVGVKPSPSATTRKNDEGRPEAGIVAYGTCLEGGSKVREGQRVVVAS